MSGADSTLNIEGANVNVNNTNSGNSPAIVAEGGGKINIGGGSTISVEGQNRDTSYKEPQFAKVTGKDSTINIDDEETVIELSNSTGLYAENKGTINFNNGTINMKGGSCCAALGIGKGDGKIVFSGGTINITGDLSGQHFVGGGYENVAIAIGSTQEECDGAVIIINGGTINLAPTSGIAIAVGGAGVEDMSDAYVGDGATIKLKATETGKAYVAAGTGGNPCLRIYVYNDTTITGEDSERNFKSPGLTEYIACSSYGDLCGAGISIYDEDYFRGSKNLSDEYPQYTKKGMGIE